MATSWYYIRIVPTDVDLSEYRNIEYVDMLSGWVCPRCSAVVSSARAHEQWHTDANER